MRKHLIRFFALGLLLAPLGLVGCASDPSTEVNSGGSVTTASEANFVGRVVDALGNAVPDAEVTLLATKKYTAKTDADGKYIINVGLGDVVGSAGAGSGDAGEVTIQRTFPIEVSKTGFATYRWSEARPFTLGYTDGSGVLILVSQAGQVLPDVVLDPMVDQFSFQIFAGSAPAANATVTVWPGSIGLYQVSKPGYEIGARHFRANADGVVSIMSTDGLPAGMTYYVDVAPYDANSDGLYEYGSAYVPMNLDIKARDSLLHYEFNGSVVMVDQVRPVEPIVLSAATQDLTVAYCNVAAKTEQQLMLQQDGTYPITVMFNRPVTDADLAKLTGPFFKLVRGGYSVPTTVSPSTLAGNYLFTVNAAQTLSTGTPAYQFSIDEKRQINGGTLPIYLTAFTFFDPNAGSRPGIIPGLDTENEASFTVDWTRILIGGADSGWGRSLFLSWPVDPAATGYTVWMSDNDTPWTEVAHQTTYDDGQFIEAALANVFTEEESFDAAAGLRYRYSGTPVSFPLAPYFGGNAIKLVVMPKNANGEAADPNLLSEVPALVLADNTGPSVLPNGWEGTVTASPYVPAEGAPVIPYNATSMKVAFSEPLEDTVLTAEYGESQFGARHSSGYFTVTDVRWPDLDVDNDSAYPSNRLYLEVDLAPAVTAAAGEGIAAGTKYIPLSSEDLAQFAVGNAVSLAGVKSTVTGFDTAGLTVAANLPQGVAAGDEVAWVGPFQAGYSSVQGNTLSALAMNDLWVTDTTGIAAERSFVTTPDGGAVTAITEARGILTLTNALGEPMAPGAAVVGYTLAATDSTLESFRTIMAPAAAEATSIRVQSATGIQVGTELYLAFGTEAQEIVTVTAVGTDTPVTLTLAAGLTNAHSAGDTVAPVYYAKAGATSLVVTQALLPAAAGKSYYLGFGTDAAERVVISPDFTGGRTLPLVSALVNDHPTNFAVAQDPGASLRGVADFETTTQGFPAVAISKIAGILPNSTMAFGGEAEPSARVIAVSPLSTPAGSGLAILDAVLAADHAAATPYVNGSSRVPDALQINVEDRSGNTSNPAADQLGYESITANFGIF